MIIPCCLKKAVLPLLIISSIVATSYASKLAEVKVVDQQYLMVHFLDGEVSIRDDGKGETAFITLGHETDNDTIKTYGDPLDIDQATETASWLLFSAALF